MQDRIKNTANEAVMGLLFVSLLVIYLVVPQSSLVTFLCVVILAISLIVAISSDWSELRVLALFAGIISLVAAFFLGQNLRFGMVSGILLTLLWGIVLALVFNRLRRDRLIAPKDRVILVRHIATGEIYLAPPPPFLLPGYRVVARIPLYDLSTDIDVKKINTPAGHDVDLIAVHIHFKVASRSDAKKVLTSFTNREQSLTHTAQAMGKPVEEARTELTFWEQLLIDLLKTTVDDIVREAVFEQAKNAVETYNQRETLANDTRRRLQERAEHWGVQISVLDFERVEVDPERFRSMNRERARAIEVVEAEHLSKMEAARVKRVLTSEVEAEAERVKAIIEALRESGVEITSDVIIRTIRAVSDWVMESDYTLLPKTAPTSTLPLLPKPAADKKDNGAKKT